MKACSTWIASLMFLTSFAPSAAGASPEKLGTIDFPTSASGEPQQHFIRGVLLLHSFEYEDAALAFREAQRIDPDFAMAYWGEAMSSNHPIWMEQDRDEALAVLKRLGPDSESRLAKATTEREKDYLRAVEILYGEGDKQGRDFAYRDAMRRLHEKHPSDGEAAAFYALSLLGTAHEGRDFAIYMRAAAVAQPVFEANPEHPGAAHYLIHSFDDPIHAPLGLPAAKSYAVIAPAAAHAQHMTSHIFVALGMWDEVVGANIAARDVQNKGFVEKGQPPRVCGHYPYWLEYGFLQQGRYEAAAEVLDTCRQRVAAGADAYELWHYSVMMARYILDTGRWDQVEAWKVDFSGHEDEALAYRFTQSFAAVKRREYEGGAPMDEISSDEPEAVIYQLEWKAMLALAQGNGDQAIALLTEALEMETSLPYEFGPPAIVKPTAELLGETLLAMGRPEKARTAFDTSLARTPRRTASLLGKARAARLLGDHDTVSEVQAELREIWQSADPDLDELEELRISADDAEISVHR